MKNLGIFILILAIGFGYVMYRPLSVKKAGFKMRMTLLLWESVFHTGHLVEYLGIAPFYKVVRKIFLAILFVPKEPDIKISHDVLNGVPVLIYRPASDDVHTARPGFVHYPGGGWVLFQPEFFHSFYSKIVRKLKVVVVGFNYRKAPEHLYPQGLNDCLHGLVAVANEASRLGIDPNQLIVAGDSAGGNLAAAVTAHVRDGGMPQFKGNIVQLILIYPVLQGLDFTLPSYIENQNEKFLTQDSMIRFWELYMRGEESWPSHIKVNNHTSAATRRKATKLIWKYLDFPPGKPKPKTTMGPGHREAIVGMQTATSDALASPLLYSDEVLKKLPPVFINTCEYDVLRDEAIALVGRLRSLSHDVVHRHYDTYHGLIFFDLHEVADMTDDMINFLNERKKNAFNKNAL